MRRTIELDETDWLILQQLQEDARTPVAALARRIGLGPTATSERVNRLVSSGVIRGFHADVDLASVGLELLALVRLRPHPGTSKALRRALEESPHVLECHHITGQDCFIIKVAAADMAHLEALTDHFAGHGETTTSMIYSSPVPRRHVTATAVPQQ